MVCDAPVSSWTMCAARVTCLTSPPAATDEAERLRAAMRMQGEEDVTKFRHILLRELLAERERLQRVLDSKVCVNLAQRRRGCCMLLPLR